MALGAGDGGALPLSLKSNPLWDVWAEGRYSAFKDDTANLGRDGHVGFLFVGTDYRITPERHRRRPRAVGLVEGRGRRRSRPGSTAPAG